MPVHESPSGFSNVEFVADFGTPVKIVGSVNMVKKAGATAKGEQEPDWYKVEAGGKEGYAPARCVVSGQVLQRQDPTRALQKAQGAPQVAGKGFSQTEEGDLNALKGMAGSAGSGSANYAAIDAILKAPAQYDPKNAYQDFRQEGRLAEFAEKK